MRKAEQSAFFAFKIILLFYYFVVVIKYCYAIILIAQVKGDL